MKKAFGKAAVLMVFLMFGTQVFCMEEKQDGAGPVHIRLKTDTVTVYQQDALVERLGDVNLVKGENHFIIEDLPQEIFPDTLMAYRPENETGYVIKEFEYKEVQSQVVLQGREKEAADRIIALKERLKAKQDSL